MVANVRAVPSGRVRQLRMLLGLSRERMARMLDVSTKTVERWEAADAQPSSNATRERLALLAEIVELGLLVYGQDGLPEFVATPLPEFGGRTAAKLIEVGQGEQVLAALAADYEGLGA